MKFSFLLFFIFSFLLSFPQEWHEKSQTLQLGIGESHTFKTIVRENIQLYTSESTRGYGKISIKTMPAIFIKMERALNKYIGIGMSVGYRKTEITQIIPYYYYDSTVAYPSPFGGYYFMQRTANDIFTFNLNDLSIGARINCHFLPNKKIDPYLGLAGGYRLVLRDYSYTTDNPHGVYYVVDYKEILPVYFAATLGVRYFPSNNVGFYAELGIDKWSVIQGGIVLKLN